MLTKNLSKYTHRFVSRFWKETNCCPLLKSLKFWSSCRFSSQNQKARSWKCRKRAWKEIDICFPFAALKQVALSDVNFEFKDQFMVLLCIYVYTNTKICTNVCKYICMNIFMHQYGRIYTIHTEPFGLERCYSTQLHKLLTELQNLDRREQIKSCSDPRFLLGLEIVSWAPRCFK